MKGKAVLGTIVGFKDENAVVEVGPDKKEVLCPLSKQMILGLNPVRRSLQRVDLWSPSTVGSEKPEIENKILAYLEIDNAGPSVFYWGIIPPGKLRDYKRVLRQPSTYIEVCRYTITHSSISPEEILWGGLKHSCPHGLMEVCGKVRINWDKVSAKVYLAYEFGSFWTREKPWKWTLIRFGKNLPKRDGSRHPSPMLEGFPRRIPEDWRVSEFIFPWRYRPSFNCYQNAGNYQMWLEESCRLSIEDDYGRLWVLFEQINPDDPQDKWEIVTAG